jgi:KDO2-lipid IV(A) lauroyltransferase
MIRVLKDGGFLAILADQRSNEGPVLPLLGQPTRVSTAPARLAVRLGLPLIPASIERTGPARFRVRVFAPMMPDPEAGGTQAQIVALTEHLARFYSARIAERPGEWLWLHDRWGIAKAERRAKRRASRAAKAGLPADTAAETSAPAEAKRDPAHTRDPAQRKKAAAE